MVYGKGLVFVIIVMVLFSQSHANKVLHLSNADFEEKVGDGKVYMVKFFAPWCGHCKRLVPTWEKLSEKLADKSDIVIASVDCTQHKDLCEKHEIKGFPTLKLFQGGESRDQYKGSRELDDIHSYILEKRSLLLEETKA